MHQNQRNRLLFQDLLDLLDAFAKAFIQYRFDGTKPWAHISIGSLFLHWSLRLPSYLTLTFLEWLISYSKIVVEWYFMAWIRYLTRTYQLPLSFPTVVYLNGRYLCEALSSTFSHAQAVLMLQKCLVKLSKLKCTIRKRFINCHLSFKWRKIKFDLKFQN